MNGWYMNIEGDLGIYTDIYDTGKLYKGTRKHLYHATCKVCGAKVEMTLWNIRKSKICPHKRGHKLNGYIEIYAPGYHSAKKNGYVYEHIVIAENMLGRQLKNGEVVHHKDKNRAHNSPDNLMVFASNSDHSRFHKTGFAIRKDDVYISPPLEKHCSDCGANISPKAVRCLECYRKNLSKKVPGKEELIEILKDKTFLQIAREYEVTDNAVRKWCKKYGLPFNRNDLKRWRLELT